MLGPSFSPSMTRMPGPMSSQSKRARDQESQLRSRPDTPVLQELEQPAVALVNSTDDVSIVDMGVGKQNQTATPATGRAFEFAQIAVRTGAARTQFRQKLGLEVRRDGMLQALRLVVNLPPLHAKKFGEHAFDQMMTQCQFAGNLAAGLSQANLAATRDPHQAVFLQAAQGHGDRGRRDLQQVRQARRDYLFALAFRFEDRLEVVLLGDGNHRE